jgi:hypothetical protein
MGRPRKKRKYTFREDKEKLTDGAGNSLVTIRAEELREVILLARTAARRMEDILFEATG